jgi:hypothetical protein
MPVMRPAALFWFSALIVAVLAGVLVLPYQRELTLVAKEDVTFYDGQDSNRVVLALEAGESRPILYCDDRKSTIEPVIRLDNGDEAHHLAGRIGIASRRTGPLSVPQYLGCGDF